MKTKSASTGLAKQKWTRGIVKTVKIVVYAVLIYVVIYRVVERTVAYDPFDIPSVAMMPTLLVGDVFFVSKFSYGYSRYSLPFGLPLFSGRIFFQPPERGDVVVFDFLLRYPVYLERALVVRDAPEAAAQVEDYERHSVEAHMVRFRYGPWDHRYRRFLNILVGKGLAAVRVEGRTIMIQLTDRGRAAAAELAQKPEFTALRHRAGLLKRHLNLSATGLMEFIYRTFPEVASLRLGETIDQ